MGHRAREEQADQIIWTLYFTDYPHEIALDYGASICLSLHGLDRHKDFATRRPRVPRRPSPVSAAMLTANPYWEQRVVAVPFGKDVCFAHANGKNFEILDAMLRAVGIPSWAQFFDPGHEMFAPYQDILR